ncbi:carbohydrate ABC transporter permease [Alicyclobacillus fodiniaquatilis]|uniref:Carbohydrate ABC transporter permease n=1 Tax=Alicyclobacillus fodiniaquatilis TaxID=1661150 RepID=A0ABW4JFT8_9BACL
MSKNLEMKAAGIQPQKKVRNRFSDNGFSWLILAVPLFLYIIFRLLPAFEAVYLSLTNYSLLTLSGKFIGLQNYVQLFHDPVFWAALKNTVEYMIVTNFGTIIIGLGLAMLLNRRKRGTVLARAIIYIPAVLSVVVMSEIAIMVFGPSNTSLMNWIVHFFGVSQQNWLNNPRESLPSLMGMQLYQGMGTTMIFYLAALQGIPSHLYEAAKLDGANAWQVFYRITLPLLRPVTMMLIILGYIAGFQAFTQMQIMTNGGPDNHTMSVVLYLYNNGFIDYKMGLASAMGVCLFIIILVVSIVQFRISWRNQMN